MKTLLLLPLLLLGCKAHTDAAKPIPDEPRGSVDFTNSTGKIEIYDEHGRLVAKVGHVGDKACIISDELVANCAVEMVPLKPTAAPDEATKQSWQDAAAALDKKITEVEHELDVKLHEPPPAMHHPSLPTPKPDRRRKGRRIPDISNVIWLPEGGYVCREGYVCDVPDDRQIADHRKPVTTPQQFTDFMNQNFPKDDK